MTVTEMVVPALAAGIFALIGSGLGAWLALGRFKRERAFDLQVEWYRDTVRTLNAAAHAAGVKAGLLADEIVPEEEIEDPGPALKKASELVLVGELFATRDAFIALDDMGRSLRELDKLKTETDSKEGRARGYRQMSESLAAGASRVATDGRRVLGLEDLDLADRARPPVLKELEAKLGRPRGR